MGKKLFVALAVGALLLLQFGDCAMAMDQQAMQCCHSMPCMPVSHDQDCCKNMISAQMPNMLPARLVSLHTPTVAAVEYPHVDDILRDAPDLPLMVNAQQHSPPELYTLHASLLI